MSDAVFRRPFDRAAHIDVPCPPLADGRTADLARQAPSQSIADSYLNQRIRVRVDQGSVDIVPISVPTSAPTAASPFPLPAYLVSAWNPRGEPTTLMRNLTGGEGLRRHLAAMAVDYWLAVTYEAGRSWVEESVVLDDFSPEGAAALGRLLGQPAVVRLDAAGLHVVPTGLVDLPPVSAPGWEVRPAPATCPMLRAGAPGQRCGSPSSPVVGRSIEAGAVWEQHRRLLSVLLGCETCADGRKPEVSHGSALALSQLSVPSRWGGWQWDGSARPSAG